MDEVEGGRCRKMLGFGGLDRNKGRSQKNYVQRKRTGKESEATAPRDGIGNLHFKKAGN